MVQLASESIEVSVPGRLELIGNHTDHQGGRVLAAGLGRRMYARARANGLGVIRAAMRGFGDVEIALDSLDARAGERGTSAAIIRGMAAAAALRGMRPMGFDLNVASDLPAGAGVSSSAAFEVLVGAAMRALWLGECEFSDEDRAVLALDAMRVEQRYFGKACGAQDQMGCAFGGVLALDFAGEVPVVERVATDFGAAGYALCLIDSGVSHTLFAADYESVPRDMARVAGALGAQRLRDVPQERFAAEGLRLAGVLGQLPVNRAVHYYAETARVDCAREALRTGDYAKFVRLAGESGESSERLLENVFPQGDGEASRAAIAPLRTIVDYCREVLDPTDGAFRIHGGGFGGSVLAIMPESQYGEFAAEMNARLGFPACMRADVSPQGVTARKMKDTAIRWPAQSKYGQLEISINLAKPEKDPHDIARAVGEAAVGVMPAGDAAMAATAARAACDLCREDANWSEARELAVNPALGKVEFAFGDLQPACDSQPAGGAFPGMPWRLHFSPYGYFPEHCIIMSRQHEPMRITKDCLLRLMDCVQRFPYYFIGCNADLPIVGGSILGHDHFQGGRKVFGLMRAPVERWIDVPALTCGGAVSCGIVRWPASTLRFEGPDPAEVAAAAAALMRAWRAFDFPEADIVHATGAGQHSTITPIGYKRAFVAGGKDGEGSASWAGGESGAPVSSGACDVKGETFVLDVVLRNNRTSAQRPWGIFHPDVPLHHIKKENIGLVEIMGLAILPPRVLVEYPGAATDVQQQAEIARAFEAVLESCAVLRRDEAGNLTQTAQRALAQLLAEVGKGQ